MELTRQDAYALKCAVSRQPIPQEITLSPVLKLLLDGLDTINNPEDWSFVQNLVTRDSTVLQQVMQEDPTAPPPVPPAQRGPDAALPALAAIPDLPKTARLSEDAQTQAKAAGRFLDDGMAWLTQRSPMTPRGFLESGLLYVVGLMIARRCVLRLDFDDIYPHLYTLWVAPTTYYRKSTGMKAITQLVRDVAPHLLLAAQSTPEALLGKLAGQRPANYDKLSPYERKLEDEGARYAAQRGVIVDEATKLLLTGKKYLDGLPEILMELFDAPDVMERELRADGKMVVYEPALSFLGATTPSRLARSITDSEWEDGLMARFALVMPEEGEVQRRTTAQSGSGFNPPDDLKRRLHCIHSAFAAPPDYDTRLTSDKRVHLDARSAALEPAALDHFNAYADAMHAMTAPTSGLDDRLRGNYGRFPVLMLKIALSLAVMDWADASSSIKSSSAAAAGLEGVPTVGLGHIARAQQITETYRAGAHRLLTSLNVSQDAKNEERILHFISLNAERPPSAREILRGTGVKNRRDMEGALQALLDAGQIEQTTRATGGRPATVYRLTERYN